LLVALRRLLGTSTALRNRVVGIFVFLALFNVVVWALAIGSAAAFPIMLPTAFLAYTFGLRHAVDADHIAAIDNSTRKLMQDGQRPVAVGFFFSLGHSTVVVALTVLVAISAGIISDVPATQQIGGVIGTAVSGTFLIVIGIINLVVLLDIYKMFRQVSAGGTYDEESLEDFLNNRGLLARLLRPMLRVVRKSWHMYPLGLLFGLGFDTASEVALLGLAATSGAGHLPIPLILLLPALFAAGMCTIDTTDGILMLGAYGWAYVKPIRKLYYNLNITLVSVIIAFVVGGIEILSIVANEFGLKGGIWDFVTGVDFGLIGVAIITVFLGSWGISTLIYRWKGYDRLGSPAVLEPSTRDVLDRAA
jgi:nickel/cobalt transporter (NiCoT) family protein